MRRVVVMSGVLVLGSMLTACGQSGALQLPSDTSSDKRAQYLLYKQPQTVSKAEAKAAATDMPASAVATQP